VGKSKWNQLANQILPSHQKVFRHYNYQTGQTTYFYRTSEKLVGHCRVPVLLKKNYRFGVSQPLNLLKLASKTKPEQLKLRKPKTVYQADFQEQLLTQLLFFCETAQFVQVPLEQELVTQELKLCNQNILAHFTPKPLLHFTFSTEAVPLVLSFLAHLDSLAHQFAITESSDFQIWPVHHNSKCETIRNLGSLCGCEITARNNYLNDWDYFSSQFTTIPGPP
jgi:hypothetical protein